MDNAKAGIPLKFIKGHTMVLDEVSDDQLTKAHPFPWTVRAPIEFMSEEHDVIDATGAVVLGDVDPDTAKALLEAASKQVVLERLTHIHIDSSPVRIEYRLEPDEFEMGSDGQTILKSMKAIKLEPGAIYELDAAGEAEIQRIARQPQVTETEDGIFITMPGPDTARTAALDLALSKVIEIALPEEGGDQREWGLRCLGIHKVLMDCGLPDLADKVWKPADADMAEVGRLALSGAFEPKPALNGSGAIEQAARALVARSFSSVKMSKSRSIQVECNDGDRGVIVHGADYDTLVEALEASRS